MPHKNRDNNTRQRDILLRLDHLVVIQDGLAGQADVDAWHFHLSFAHQLPQAVNRITGNVAGQAALPEKRCLLINDQIVGRVLSDSATGGCVVSRKIRLCIEGDIDIRHVVCAEKVRQRREKADCRMCAWRWPPGSGYWPVTATIESRNPFGHWCSGRRCSEHRIDLLKKGRQVGSLGELHDERHLILQRFLNGGQVVIRNEIQGLGAHGGQVVFIENVAGNKFVSGIILAARRSINCRFFSGSSLWTTTDRSLPCSGNSFWRRRKFC